MGKGLTGSLIARSKSLGLLEVQLGLLPGGDPEDGITSLEGPHTPWETVSYINEACWDRWPSTSRPQKTARTLIITNRGKDPMYTRPSWRQCHFPALSSSHPDSGGGSGGKSTGKKQGRCWGESTMPPSHFNPTPGLVGAGGRESFETEFEIGRFKYTGLN